MATVHTPNSKRTPILPTREGSDGSSSRFFRRLSNDPKFEEKFWDVIGLYLDPPERALVLCCDEKSQCQALERTQPGLPLGVGHIRTKTHDYTRHGTITLFAALNYLDGKLIARTEERHTHIEWLRFLKQIERETPKELDLHLIVDNYSTHKELTVTQWLAKHPRFHVHFTPTSSSWMNLVERFFGELTQDVIRDGSFTSVRELVADIMSYLAQRNLDPKPYRWKAKGEEILRKIKRAREALAAQEAATG
jgi:transposase